MMMFNDPVIDALLDESANSAFAPQDIHRMDGLLRYFDDAGRIWLPDFRVRELARAAVREMETRANRMGLGDRMALYSVAAVRIPPATMLVVGKAMIPFPRLMEDGSLAMMLEPSVWVENGRVLLRTPWAAARIDLETGKWTWGS